MTITLEQNNTTKKPRYVKDHLLREVIDSYLGDLLYVAGKNDCHMNDVSRMFVGHCSQRAGTPG